MRFLLVIASLAGFVPYLVIGLLNCRCISRKCRQGKLNWDRLLLFVFQDDQFSVLGTLRVQALAVGSRYATGIVDGCDFADGLGKPVLMAVRLFIHSLPWLCCATSFRIGLFLDRFLGRHLEPH